MAKKSRYHRNPSGSWGAESPQKAAEIRERFPFREAELAVGRPIEFCWTFDVRGTPEKLWPVVNETSRLMGFMKLPELALEEVEGGLRGETAWYGLSLRFFEPPWEWVDSTYYIVRRHYDKGPIAHYHGVCSLEAIDEARTRVVCYFAWIPANAVGRLLLKAVFSKTRLGLGLMLARVEEWLEKGMPGHPIRHRRMATADAAALARLKSTKARLLEQGLPSLAVTELIRHLETADDLDLHRIQLRPLARRLGLELRDLLRVSLHATREGIVTLQWDVICPLCRGARESHSQLMTIPRRGFCRVCQHEFSIANAHAIEVTFRAHPTVRDTTPRHYCTAEPAHRPHIKAQQIIEPGGTARVTPLLDLGAYRLRSQDGAFATVLDASARGAAEPQRLIVTRLPERVECGLHPTFELVNPTEQRMVVLIEAAALSDDRLEPHDLLSSQAFRELFSSELLDTGTQLDVGQQAILFVDIIQSSHWFAEKGDANAFSALLDFFQELAETAERHGGALVKGLGDGGMLAFAEPCAAFEAAHAIQLAMVGSKPRVRVSGHLGPCIAVSLNGVLDYFGRTVVIAQRLQRVSGAAEVVLSRELFEALCAERPDLRAGAPELEVLPLPELEHTAMFVRLPVLPDDEQTAGQQPRDPAASASDGALH